MILKGMRETPMALSWPAKGPNEVLDYLVRWHNRVGAAAFPAPNSDSLADATFEVTVGSVVVEESSFDPVLHTATVKLSGGVVGDICEVVCHVTTVETREWDQTVRIRIKPQ